MKQKILILDLSRDNLPGCYSAVLSLDMCHAQNQKVATSTMFTYSDGWNGALLSFCRGKRERGDPAPLALFLHLFRCASMWAFRRHGRRGGTLLLLLVLDTFSLPCQGFPKFLSDGPFWVFLFLSLRPAKGEKL